MLNIGVVGYGYWGPNLVRNFEEVSGSTVRWVSDFKPENLAKVQKRYPGIKTTTNFQDLLNDPTLDAIAISTPVSTHFDLAMKALQANKHVLVEKPLTANSKQAKQLIEEADKRKKILMVDHTFIYTGAVRRIKELLNKEQIGHIYYYDSVRINLGLFQHDINVLWDLAVHDLAIMDFLLERRPTSVIATGAAHVSSEPENIAYLTCFFEDNLIAHINVNWLAPVKIRRTLIGGDKQMIVYDDLEPIEKVKIYDKGVIVNDKPEGVYKLLLDYRTGDMWAPQIDTLEALKNEAVHFVQCVSEGKKPITDGEDGLRVVKILEAATESLTQSGKRISLDWTK